MASDTHWDETNGYTGHIYRKKMYGHRLFSAMGNLCMVILSRPVDRIQSHGSVRVFRGAPIHPRHGTPPSNRPTSRPLSGGRGPDATTARTSTAKLGFCSTRLAVNRSVRDGCCVAQHRRRLLSARWRSAHDVCQLLQRSEVACASMPPLHQEDCASWATVILTPAKRTPAGRKARAVGKQ